MGRIVAGAGCGPTCDRPGRADPSPAREAAGVAIVAATTVVVALAVILAGVGAGALWIFEALAGTGMLVGLVVAFGAFDRRTARARRARGSRRSASAGLGAAVDAQLRTLDQVEHRRLDLGDPWPSLVVGPTGVSVVTVADGVPGSVQRARETLAVARSLVQQGAGGDRPVRLALLAVVPDGVVPADEDDEITTVSLGDLGEVLARGPIVPMVTVTDLFARLSGQLAPGPQFDTV